MGALRVDPRSEDLYHYGPSYSFDLRGQDVIYIVTYS